MTSSKTNLGNLERERAEEAIRRVASVFCERCAASQDALTADDWDKFDQMFQLQHVAWLNLNALAAKYESSFDHLTCEAEVRTWIEPCKTALDCLMLEMSRKLSRIEIEGRVGGRLKRHLSAFQAGSSIPVQFLKGA